MCKSLTLLAYVDNKAMERTIRKFIGSKKTERKNNFALIKYVDDSKKKRRE